MNYEKRLLKFLKDNPTLRLTPKQIAGVWKRNHTDVSTAAFHLFKQGKIKVDNFALKLNTCEGIGGA